MDHYWPGNVRELQNVIERASALTTGDQLEAADIQLDSPRNRPSSSSDRFLPEGMTLDQWEDEMIRESLKRANGNKSQAARLLGLSRNALRYRLRKSASTTTNPSERDLRNACRTAMPAEPQCLDHRGRAALQGRVIDRARLGFSPRCPRACPELVEGFAPVLWALTWAKTSLPIWQLYARPSPTQ